MPETDHETDVRSIWNETVKRIREGRANDLPRMGEFNICHVRPHAANGEDKILAPDGKYYVKKSLWLNQGYVSKRFSLKDYFQKIANSGSFHQQIVLEPFFAQRRKPYKTSVLNIVTAK